MKKTGIYKRLLTLAVAPILILGIVITFFCYERFKNTLYKESKESMTDIARTVAVAYNIAYDGDYALVKSGDDKYDFHKGDYEITSDYSIVDKFAEAFNVDISVLYMDMRVHTTFKTESGTRLAGVYTNAQTTNDVLSLGEDVFYRNITILTDEYLIYYTPLKNSDGSIIGMIEVAKKTSSLKAAVLRAVWPVLLLAAFGMALAAFISFRYTKDFTDTLKKIQLFLNKISSGNLSAEMDGGCLRRPDELGEISKSSVSMAKSIRASVETDPLTGLNNRRYVHSAVQRIAERAATTGVPFAVAITDIDFFKKVNDTYGHNAGDEVLKAVAGKLKECMVGKGFAARWGGEEFVLIFEKTNMADSVPALEALEDNIRGMTVYADGFEIKITMTIGITDGHGSDIEKLVEEADAKLYYGKEHGRNQIVSVIPEEQTSDSPLP